MAIGSEFRSLPQVSVLFERFQTTEANNEVGAIPPKAMPVILTQPYQLYVRMNAPPEMFYGFSCFRRIVGLLRL